LIKKGDQKDNPQKKNANFGHFLIDPH
jgi:hypothetical protein